ncbi:MAG: rhomboid family intramembrane serine protease [Sedimentisphaerales bacterium]|nr:rhomboid family intramembrane serine protease [Sedimentisphaerales bacterium]
MGLYDRDYTQEDYKSQFRYSPQMSMPRITNVVKWLLIINIAVYIPSALSASIGGFTFKWFSVWPETTGMALQLWRVITYQFLHDTTDIRHIFFNMLVLFFFGPMLEGVWGGRKFLIFYLICGAAGGLLYPMLVLSGAINVPAQLVGASGAILGMLAAGALLFPNSIVLIMFVFPMRLCILAIILAAISILNLFAGTNQGGEVAHLAGMAAGVIYVLSDSWRSRFKFKSSAGKWEKQISEQRNLQIELDRILDKVHKSGIHSLTFKEKRTLKKATRVEQMKNKL